MTTTEPNPNYGRGEILEPQIEGLRVVGTISPELLSSLSAGADLSDQDITGELAQLTEGLPDPEPAIDVYKLDFDESAEDPFGAAKINGIIGGHSSRKAHKDAGFKVTRLVSDSNGTIFFPSDENGDPDFNKPYQAPDGVIVEFTDQVWHTAPYSARGSGTRTQISVR